jgi:hypothetical protein
MPKGHGVRNPKLPKLKPGKCRYCGCTETRACVLTIVCIEHSQVPIMCCWWDHERTVCSNPSCVKKHELEAA